MLVEEKKVSIQSSGMKDTVDFRAKLDGMMFDNLINGIYSNKIGAGIREYATNARDGHARRGNLSTPFEVSLPTKDKAFFEVRDFGSSLTHDEVFNIFAVLGESTKRNTNDETGCLGLGSKSAFAYTNNFSVTCWKDGIKRDYSCYIGESGQPKVSLISKIPSNEPQGVRVSYAVKQEDINDFNLEASKQLRGFDPMPEIKRHNHNYEPLKEENLVLKGKDWSLYKSGAPSSYSFRVKGNPMAIQGSVAYPINSSNNSLRTAIRNIAQGENSERILKMLDSTDIIIKFPIGTLKMTTSREELAYDEKTCENIANKCSEVLKEIQEKLDEEYKSCKSLKEARILRAKTRNTGLTEIERILNIRERYWNNQEIDPFVYLAEVNESIGQLVERYRRVYNKTTPDTVNKFLGKTVKGELRRIAQYHYRNKFGEYKVQFAFPEMTNKNAESATEIAADEVSSLKVLVEVGNVSSFNARMRKFWKDILTTSDKSFLWIKVSSVADAQEFLEAIYHDNPSNVWFLSNLDELKMPSKGGSGKGSVVITATERKFRYFKTKRYAYNSDVATYKNIDFSKQVDKLPVVFAKGNKFYLTLKDHNDEVNGKNYQDTVTYLNDWATDQEVFIINGQQMKFYEDNKSKFVEVMEVLKPLWIKNNPNWELEYAKTQWTADDSYNQMWGRKLKVLRGKGLYFNAIDTELVKRTDDLSKNKGSYRSVRNVLPSMYQRFLEKEMEQALLKHPQPQNGLEFQNFATQDPTLQYLLSEVSEWGVDGDLFEALKHYKQLKNL